MYRKVFTSDFLLFIIQKPNPFLTLLLHSKPLTIFVHQSRIGQTNTRTLILENPSVSVCASFAAHISQACQHQFTYHVGYGSSAVVYEAIYKPLKKRVAVKMIDLDMFERNQIDELRVFITLLRYLTCSS